jgi:hypothetical protein
VELKFVNNLFFLFYLQPVNRTKVELKYSAYTLRLFQYHLLIAPKWN